MPKTDMTKDELLAAYRKLADRMRQAADEIDGFCQDHEDDDTEPTDTTSNDTAHELQEVIKCAAVIYDVVCIAEEAALEAEEEMG